MATSPKPTIPRDSAQIVDEFGALAAKLAPVKADHNRYDELRKLISSWFSAAAADQEFTVSGKSYSVVVSARRPERWVKSMAALAKRLGAKLFHSLVTPKFGEMDKHIPEAEQPRYFEKKPTGYRTVRVNPK
jgi:hypothetical protein